jgi:hypothetical protein
MGLPKTYDLKVTLLEVTLYCKQIVIYKYFFMLFFGVSGILLRIWRPKCIWIWSLWIRTYFAPASVSVHTWSPDILEDESNVNRFAGSSVVVCRRVEWKNGRKWKPIRRWSETSKIHSVVIMKRRKFIRLLL